MLIKAQEAGAHGCEDLAKAGACGRHPKNLARDMLRKLVRNVDFPKPYFAKIPLNDANTGVDSVMVDYPFLLPHEVIHWGIATGRMAITDLVNVADRVDQKLVDMKGKFCEKFALDPDLTILLGFHGDGVAHHKGLKQASTEVYSWNLLCQQDGERYLFTLVPKHFLCSCGCPSGRCTVDAVMKVFAWSMQVLVSGHWPAARHDGEPLDKAHRHLAGKPLGFCGGLQQARGDWMWYQQVFAFPHWTADRICWKCGASQTGRCSYKNFKLDAPWRSTRKSPSQCMSDIIKTGKGISPLFACPGFTVDMVVIGALHCLDLGVTAEILGNIMWEWMQTLRRMNIKVKVKTLWVKLKQWYIDNKPTSQLQGLTKDMIRKDGKYPKLKAKGGETRSLVPFCLDLAKEMWEKTGTDHCHMVLMVIRGLHNYYSLMMVGQWDSVVASKWCQQVLEVYKKLHLEAIQKKSEHVENQTKVSLVSRACAVPISPARQSQGVLGVQR